MKKQSKFEAGFAILLIVIIITLIYFDIDVVQIIDNFLRH